MPTETHETVERSKVETQKAAVIRGRCIDEHGQPLAGVPVHLRGWRGNAERMARHELDHGKVEWSDPAPVLTAADGRFELRFDPPPPYQFLCEPQAEGRVRVYGRWGSIEPGAELDMGDVVLEPGIAVAGRVVDESGLPVANRYITLESTEGSGSPPLLAELTRRDWFQAHVDDRGMFRGHWPLPAGTYSVDVRDARLKSPSEPIRIAAPRADLHLVVVVNAQPPSIEGVVVDERGAPLSTARICPRDSFGTETNREGRFVLRQGNGTPKSAIELSVQAEGHAEWRSEGPVEWGTKDLRIVLPAGPPLTIAVRRGDDGAPVQRYGVLLAPVRENGGWSSADDELKHLGEHQGGVLRIAKMSTGRYRLTVVPAESTGLPESRELVIAIEPGVPKHVEFRLDGLAERGVVVTDTSGCPVVGARVELLLNRGSRELDLESIAMRLRDARMNSPEHVAVLVDEGVTDETGRTILQGRSSDVFALRLPGPGAVPTLVAPFSLDEPDDAQVVVAVGGTLRGRLEPAAVVNDLRQDAGFHADGAVTDPRRKVRLPTVYLRRAGGPPYETFPSRGGQAGVPLGSDGSFEMAGVPPGDWDLIVHWWQLRPSPGGFQGGSTHRVAERGITFTEGSTVVRSLDLTKWLRYPVTIRARLDGQPFTGSLVLGGRLPGPGGEDATDRRIVPVAAEEEVQVELGEGTWTLGGFAQLGHERLPLLGPELVVGPRGPRHVDVDFRVASCVLRILDHEGNPVPGVVLDVHHAGTGLRLEPMPTDEAGLTTLRGPAVTVQLRTRRKPLMDDVSFFAWAREHAGDGSQQRAIVELGTAELVVGGAEPRTIRLPADWSELPK